MPLPHSYSIHKLSLIFIPVCVDNQLVSHKPQHNEKLKTTIKMRASPNANWTHLCDLGFKKHWLQTHMLPIIMHGWTCNRRYQATDNRGGIPPRNPGIHPKTKNVWKLERMSTRRVLLSFTPPPSRWIFGIEHVKFGHYRDVCRFQSNAVLRFKNRSQTRECTFRQKRRLFEKTVVPRKRLQNFDC